MTYPNLPTESASDYTGSTSFVAPSDHTKTEKRHKKKKTVRIRKTKKNIDRKTYSRVHMIGGKYTAQCLTRQILPHHGAVMGNGQD